MILSVDKSFFIEWFPVFFQCATFINQRTGRINLALFFFRFLTNILILASTIYCSGRSQNMIFMCQDLFPAFMFVLTDAVVAKYRRNLISLLKFLSEPTEVSELKPSHLKVARDFNKVTHRISQIAFSILAFGSLTWAFFPLPYLLKLNIQEVKNSGECIHLSFGWIPAIFVSRSVVVVGNVISGIICILNTMLIFAWSLQLLFTVLKLKVELQIICIDLPYLNKYIEDYIQGRLQSDMKIPLCMACQHLKSLKLNDTFSKHQVKFLEKYEMFKISELPEPKDCCSALLKERLMLAVFKRRFQEAIDRHNRVIKLVQLTNESFNLQVMMFCQLAVPVGALIIANPVGTGIAVFILGLFVWIQFDTQNFTSHIDSIKHYNSTVSFHNFLLGHVLVFYRCNQGDNVTAIEYINRGIHIAGVFDLSGLYNYCGQILLNESEQLRDALYQCDWMDKPREIQRFIIMMQTVANRPLCLTSGRIYTLSMESYKKVLSTVYSYTNVLQSLRS